MSDFIAIKTTKIIYPQIYAYILPTVREKQGWIKIGYTERENVDIRIKEQTHTAAINLEYKKLWVNTAKFNDSDEWFRDSQFHAYLQKYKNIKQEPNTEWFYYNGTPEQSYNDFNDFRNHAYNQAQEKLNYQLRNEQKAAVEQTLEYIKENSEGEFLWNAKPRFGKTLTTYDLVRKLEAHKVLIVTNRPAIANSWFDDFEKFIAWQTDFAFVSTSDSLNNRPVMSREEFLSQNKKTHMLAFISLQDLKGAISFGGNFDKLSWVKEMEWDLLVIDEAHEGIDTFKTDMAFDEINRNFTLHLSGTPFKAIASGKFNKDKIFNWTYVDEQRAKNYWKNKEENNPYEKLPRLNLFSYQMSQMITDEVNKGAQIEGDNIDFAFDLNEFFATNESGKFLHESDINKWLDSLSRNEKYPFSTRKLRDELKHTFWLLERVASARALQKLLQNHPVFENYEVILAAGDGRSNDDEQIITQKSLDRVRKALAIKDKKTITLSVGQLTTGITVPEWSAVLMLSNIKSPSQYMQAAFRAQNPWEYTINGQVHQKENAYIFDFAPERTLTIYDDFANNLLSNTSGGGGTIQDREEHIKELLNFFPVIAEDDEGKMVELDVTQVLTIPKTIKAQEVVRRGFMSNLLFQNISGIFASTDVREILEQLSPVDIGKNIPRTTHQPIDIHGVELDGKGNVEINQDIIIAQTDARFGEKIYVDIKSTVEDTINYSTDNLSKTIANTITQNTQDIVKDLAKENGLTVKAASQIIQQSEKSIAREIEVVQKRSEIKQAEAEVEYKKVIAEVQNDAVKVAEAQALYDAKKQEIEENFKKEIISTVEVKSKELTQQSTETILKKAEENKKNIVEDDVRARLRGFTRTIPSFLMAYGNASTTLATFDTTINNDVFKEVTGITLEQFRILRDEFCFFDEIVFNESAQEFLSKREKLSDYFDQSLEEDIFDYIPPQQTNQIFTPKRVVEMMLDSLENEDPDIFKDPNKTFADLYMKSGLYLTEIVKRLYVGLEEQMPDNAARLKHILEQQVYGFAPSEIIYNIARNFIFGFDETSKNINESHIVCLDTVPYAKGEMDFEAKCAELFGETKEMKFDVVVGNPPYQETAKGESTKDMPVYNYFYDLAEKISSRYCLISPARFLFNAGSTDKIWNEKMLNNKNIKVSYYEQKSANIFPGTDIKGGIAVLYHDKSKDFGEIGTFTSFQELNSIIQKVSNLTKKTLDEIVANRGQYRYDDKIYNDYPLEMTVISDRRIASNAFQKLPHLFFDVRPNDGFEYVQIYGRFDNDRGYKWFNRDYLAEPDTFEKYKIILPKANGSGAIGEVLSTPLIGEPLIGFTETFISIGSFDNELEAQNALKYIKSKFARTMLGVLKITQDNPRDKWQKVPLQDFTSLSDIDWSKSIPEIDQQLYKKYSLDQNEIDFIESKVKSME